MGPTFSIFLGNKKTMYQKAINESCFGDPLDLTDCAEIDVAMPNADGTFAHFLLSLDKVIISEPANLGKFSVPIPSATSALFNVGEFQDVNVTFTMADASKFTVRFQRALSVFEVLAYSDN